MTQLELVQKGTISSQMEAVAQYDKIDTEVIRQGIANGTVVIPANINHTNLTPRGIGQGLKNKVNANIVRPLTMSVLILNWRS